MKARPKVFLQSRCKSFNACYAQLLSAAEQWTSHCLSACIPWRRSIWTWPVHGRFSGCRMSTGPDQLTCWYENVGQLCNLAAHATRIPSEWLLSSAGDICSDWRTCFFGWRSWVLSFIKENLNSLVVCANDGSELQCIPVYTGLCSWTRQLHVTVTTRVLSVFGQMIALIILIWLRVISHMLQS